MGHRPFFQQKRNADLRRDCTRSYASRPFYDRLIPVIGTPADVTPEDRANPGARAAWAPWGPCNQATWRGARLSCQLRYAAPPSRFVSVAGELWGRNTRTLRGATRQRPPPPGIKRIGAVKQVDQAEDILAIGGAAVIDVARVVRNRLDAVEAVDEGIDICR